MHKRKKSKFFYDFSRSNVSGSAFYDIIDSIGSERTIFGVKASFQYTDTQIVKLHFS